MGLQAVDEQFDKLRTAYNQRIQEAHKDYQTNVTQIRLKYIMTLEALKPMYQQAGNLDALLALNAEMERFGKDQTVAEIHVVETPPELATRQQAYIDYVGNQKKTYAKRVMDTSKFYAGHLEEMVTTYTRSDNVDMALLARSERTKLGIGTLVKWAGTQVEDDYFVPDLLADPQPEDYPVILDYIASFVQVESRGYVSNEERGSAMVYLEDKKILDNPKRGLNVVAMSMEGDHLLNATYETYGEKNSAGKKFAGAISNLPSGTFVAVAVAGDGGSGFNESVRSGIQQIGGDPDTLMNRESIPSYYCVGMKGLPSGLAKEKVGGSVAAWPDLARVNALAGIQPAPPPGPARVRPGGLGDRRPGFGETRVKPPAGVGALPTRRTLRKGSGFRGLQRSGEKSNR